MRSIAVMNQKGGVAKTTSSVNLAAGLARAGKRVCLIDLDPQGHGSLHLGIEAMGDIPTMYDVFTGQRPLSAVRRMVASNLWVAPSNIDLAATELELVDAANRETVLRDAIAAMTDEQPFDYIVMDCPPSLGVLTVNALTAAREVFIPLQPHFFALQGLSKLFETTALVTRRLNRDLRVTGIVLCLYETGTRLAADITEDLIGFLQSADPEAPWANARIFNTRIRRNIKLAEAPSFGQSIFAYVPNSAGAKDYEALTQEVLADEAQQVPGGPQAPVQAQAPAAAEAPPVELRRAA
ncbi:MAG: ParA family protein [Planctomycetaceae bacterium]|nr:ParA family protein [Planctomycetaceae bacterium]MCA9113814.1 ParA family protein [Planctomycetaceae bacterium]